MFYNTKPTAYVEPKKKEGPEQTTSGIDHYTGTMTDLKQGWSLNFKNKPPIYPNTIGGGTDPEDELLQYDPENDDQIDLSGQWKDLKPGEYPPAPSLSSYYKNGYNECSAYPYAYGPWYQNNYKINEDLWWKAITNSMTERDLTHPDIEIGDWRWDTEFKGDDKPFVYKDKDGKTRTRVNKKCDIDSNIQYRWYINYKVKGSDQIFSKSLPNKERLKVAYEYCDVLLKKRKPFFETKSEQKLVYGTF